MKFVSKQRLTDDCVELPPEEKNNQDSEGGVYLFNFVIKILIYQVFFITRTCRKFRYLDGSNRW